MHGHRYILICMIKLQAELSAIFLKSNNHHIKYRNYVLLVKIAHKMVRYYKYLLA